MTRDFSTSGNNLIVAPTGTYNSNTNFPLAAGTLSWTRGSSSISPTSTTGGIVFAKLTSSAIAQGTTYKLSYTVSGANGATLGSNDYLLFLQGHAQGNGNVNLPTSIGDHEIFFTQGAQVAGNAIASTIVDAHGNTIAVREYIAFGHSGSNPNTSFAISNFDFRPVKHDLGPMGQALTATTAYPTYGPNGTQGSKNPDTNKVQLTAVSPRIVKNMEVRGIGLHSGTYVTGVDGEFITLSSPPSSAGIPKGTTLTFYSPTTLINASDLRFKMTQATDDGSTAPSTVVIEGDLLIKSIGTYDVDVDFDLGAFIEANDTSPPAA